MELPAPLLQFQWQKCQEFHVLHATLALLWTWKRKNPFYVRPSKIQRILCPKKCPKGPPQTGLGFDNVSYYLDCCCSWSSNRRSLLLLRSEVKPPACSFLGGGFFSAFSVYYPYPHSHLLQRITGKTSFISQGWPIQRSLLAWKNKNEIWSFCLLQFKGNYK